MSILALDLSTTRTGWCLDVNGLPTWGHIEPPETERHGRVYYTVAKISSMIDAASFAGDPIDRAVVEDIGLYKGNAGARNQNLGTVIMLAELRGAVDYEVRRLLGIDLIKLALSTVRSKALDPLQKAAGGWVSGLPSKAQVRKSLESMGYATSNDDESDAIAVYLAYKNIQKGKP